MEQAHLSARIKQICASLGFERSGIARAGRIPRADYFREWLDSGRAGTMQYMHRNFEARIDATKMLDGAKSVIVVAHQYRQVLSENPNPRSEPPRGRIAQYAWGEDYHVVVKDKLLSLVSLMGEEVGPFEARVCVDTSPVMEREWAAAAGVGWIGKNTLVLHESLGSYFFLGAVVTTLDLVPDEPVADHCGTCTACLDACPTQAFPAPYEMDAARCISYLTIEHRGDIAEEFHRGMGEWVFGCDVCQDVCPHNRRAPATKEPRYAARASAPSPVLDDVLAWSEADYRAKLAGSAMRRAKLDMLKRNARIARSNAKTGSQPPCAPVAEPVESNRFEKT